MNQRNISVVVSVIFWSCLARAQYVYEHIPQSLTKEALVDITWHPSGDYALIGDSSGKIIRVESSDFSVTQVADLVDFQLFHMDFNPDGSEALIVGCYFPCALGEGRIYRWHHNDESVTRVLSGTSIKVARGVEFSPDGSIALVATWLEEFPLGFLHVHEYESSTQNFPFVGLVSSGGPCDVSWRNDGTEALIAICEYSASVYAYDPSAPVGNRLTSTGYESHGSYAVAIDHHPIEGFGLVVDSTHSIYKWDGTWSNVDLQAGNILKSVAFSSDGSRALIVGRATLDSGNVSGTVYEFSGSASSFTTSDFSDVSISGFGSPPWGGDENTYFEAIAFRPGLCEGLIVGRHGSTNDAFSPIARFTDSRGSDCRPTGEDGGIIEDGFDGDGANETEDEGTTEDVNNDGVDGAIETDHDQDQGDDGQVFPCTSDDQCPNGSYCDGEFCVTDCGINDDCPADHVCTDRGRCVADEGRTSDCSCSSSSMPNILYAILILLALMSLRGVRKS